MNRAPAKKFAASGLGYLVPKGAMLEKFSALITVEKGVCLADLPPMTRISLRTSNSEYLITVLDPFAARIRVQGGRFFATPTEAVLWGASLGGALLKTNLIGIGLQLELAYETKEGRTRRLVTSPVDHLLIGFDGQVDWQGVSGVE